MGCDIHLHTEIKVNGVWHHYSHPNISRWYALFYKMAGVRGPVDDIVPIAEPRGLPPDLSFTTRLDYEHDVPNAHSESWLSGEELDAVLEWADSAGRRIGVHYRTIYQEFGYLFGNSYKLHPEERGSAYPAVVEDVRAVFWFDN